MTKMVSLILRLFIIIHLLHKQSRVLCESNKTELNVIVTNPKDVEVGYCFILILFSQGRAILILILIRLGHIDVSKVQQKIEPVQDQRSMAGGWLAEQLRDEMVPAT